MPTNARAALRDGTWWPPATDGLAVLALLAVLADLATTTLASGGGATFPAAGHEWGPLAGGVVFVAGKLVLLAVAWLRFGPVSTFVAVYLVVAMGLGGASVTALELLTGIAPLAPLPMPARYLLAPVVATPLGVAVVDVVHENPPWVEVGLVAVALLLAEVDVVVASLALRELPL